MYIIFYLSDLLTIGCVRDVVTLSICFLLKTGGGIISHSSLPEETVVSSHVTVRTNRMRLMSGNDLMQRGKD